jgi:hypothetical protein
LLCSGSHTGIEKRLADHYRNAQTAFDRGILAMEGFDQWAFAIYRRRRAPLGKMDMLKAVRFDPTEMP